MTSTARVSERIVVGIDGSLSSHAAVRWALNHARPDDTIMLLHAWESSPSMVDVARADADDESSARRFAHHELERARQLLCDDTITLSCEVVHGDARDSLCREPSDLLVVGARGHGVLAGILLGSVSAHLAHHCPVPLVIVPFPARTTHR